MSPRHIALILTSWRRLLPIRDRAGTLFYRRLFELDPTLRRLFHGDVAEQSRKLMAMLGIVVSHLDRLGDIVPAVEELGRRHAEYGVEDAHYDTVGAALLGTLRAALGESLSQDAEEAWTAAYGTLAEVMKNAAGRRPGCTPDARPIAS